MERIYITQRKTHTHTLISPAITQDIATLFKRTPHPSHTPSLTHTFLPQTVPLLTTLHIPHPSTPPNTPSLHPYHTPSTPKSSLHPQTFLPLPNTPSIHLPTPSPHQSSFQACLRPITPWSIHRHYLLSTTLCY